MRLFIYSIFDVATGAYMRPFFLQADAAAQRAFEDLVATEDHEVAKHPEHYSLFRLGVFDDNKGTIVGEAPECLQTGLQAFAENTVKPEDKVESVIDKGDG